MDGVCGKCEHVDGVSRNNSYGPSFMNLLLAVNASGYRASGARSESGFHVVHLNKLV